MCLKIIKNKRPLGKAFGAFNKVLVTIIFGVAVFTQMPRAFADTVGTKFFLNIPAQPIADAMKTLSYQTEHSVLFRTDVLGDGFTQAIQGEYSLQQALDSLLANTSLKGGLTESEVIVISLKTDADAPAFEETTLTNKNIKKSLLTGAVALAIIGGTTIYGQEESPDVSGETRLIETEDGQIIEEMTVVGRRLNSLLSIDAKRYADQIVDVLSADEANKLPDNNLAESLSRIPGVTITRDGESGDGRSVSVRGLDSALLSIQFDGVPIGTATTDTRSITLNSVSTDNVSQIRVSKSLQAKDESEGIGGTINVISKTPLGVGKDVYTFDIAGRYGEFSEELGGDVSGSINKIINENLGVRVSAFKQKRFIRNLSVEADSPILSGFTGLTAADGSFVTAATLIDPDGFDFDDTDRDYRDLPQGIISPDFVEFEDHTYDLQRQERDLLSVSGAIDWQVIPSTLLTLGGRISEETTDALDSQFTFSESDNNYDLVGDRLVAQYRRADISLQTRIEDRESLDKNIYLKGLTEKDNYTFSFLTSWTRSERDNPRTILSFENDEFIDDEDRDPACDGLTFHPYTGGSLPVPNIDAVNSPCFRRVVEQYADVQSLSRINASLSSPNTNNRALGKIDFTYDIDESSFGGVFDTISVGTKFETSDRFSPIRSFRDSGSEFFNVDGTFAPNEDGTADFAPLSDFPGLFGGFDTNSFSFIGSNLPSTGFTGVPVLDEDAFRILGNRILQNYAGDEVNVFSRFKEDTSAAYVQANFEFDKLDFSIGTRFDQYKGDFSQTLRLEGEVNFDNDPNRRAIDISNPNLSTLQVNQTKNTEILPRLNGRYEIRDDLQLRFGAGYSIARPSFRQLGRSAVTEFRIDVDEDFNIAPGITDAAALAASGELRPDIFDDFRIKVTSGNPDLENAKSRNLDLSLEYYPKPGTAFTIGAFHKRITDFIFLGEEEGGGGLNRDIILAGLSPGGIAVLDAVGGLDAILDGALVRRLGTRPAVVNITQPKNGDVATVKGVELAVSHQLDYLPSFWSNLGFNAHLTLNDTEAVAIIEDEIQANRDGAVAVALGYFQDGDVQSQVTGFRNAPDVSANMVIYYEDERFDIALSGNYASESYLSDTFFGFNRYLDRNYQLDFFAGYTLPDNSFFKEAKIFVEIPDITDGGSKPTSARTIGVDGPLTSAGYNGREIRFGIRSKF